MSAVQHQINDAVIVVDKLERGIGQGNKVIRTIDSLDTTEQDVIAVKKRIKEYGITILKRFSTKATQMTPSPTPAPPTSALLTNDLQIIQTRLDKMKKFAHISREIIKK